MVLSAFAYKIYMADNFWTMYRQRCCRCRSTCSHCCRCWPLWSCRPAWLPLPCVCARALSIFGICYKAHDTPPLFAAAHCCENVWLPTIAAFCWCCSPPPPLSLSLKLFAFGGSRSRNSQNEFLFCFKYILFKFNLLTMFYFINVKLNC